jgi:hypothetical protein
LIAASTTTVATSAASAFRKGHTAVCARPPLRMVAGVRHRLHALKQQIERLLSPSIILFDVLKYLRTSIQCA